ASGGAPVLRRATFTANLSNGAVAFVGGSGGVVEDAVFEENTGSGAYVDASSPVFRRTTFRDNVTTAGGTNGAGVHVDGGAPRFEDCLFERLRTRHDLSGHGGGVLVRGDEITPALPAFVRTTFRD